MKKNLLFYFEKFFVKTVNRIKLICMYKKNFIYVKSIVNIINVKTKNISFYLDQQMRKTLYQIG